MSQADVRAESSTPARDARTPGAKPLDGRIARGIRTRESVVLAFEALIREGGPIPTAAQVAERAGVSCRSVFTHFGDMDGVVCAVAQRFVEHLRANHRPVSPELGLTERIALLASQRADDLEQITPLFRTASLQNPLSESMRAILEAIGEGNREYILSLFARELAALPEHEPRVVGEALIAVTSWDHWRGLRQPQALSSETARQVMQRELHALLETSLR